MSDNKLQQFKEQRYLALESYRKDGTAVSTPMCFIVENNVLYLRTNCKSWKVKRLLKNSRVRVVPSDPGGKPLGKWVEAKTQLFDLGEMEWVYQRFKQKYRLEQHVVNLMIKLRKLHYIVVAVRLDAPLQNGIQPA